MYYSINEDKTYVAEPLVEENRFITKEKEIGPIPDYKEVKALLPELAWDGHEDTVAMYNRAWELADRLNRFISHLTDEREFKRPHMIPTLSFDHPDYSPTGSYWQGGVWAPMDYMVLKGLKKCGHDSLACQIARNHIENVTEVFKRTDTLWENYAPERCAPGEPAKPDFVGWTGLSAIAVPIEFVPDAMIRKPAR